MHHLFEGLEVSFGLLQLRRCCSRLVTCLRQLSSQMSGFLSRRAQRSLHLQPLATHVMCVGQHSSREYAWGVDVRSEDKSRRSYRQNDTYRIP